VNNQLKDSKTKVNLMKAFAGESQARNRYTFAAEAARLQKMYAIANVFEFTADQERAHAKRFYDLLKELSGETIEITGGYPVDQQPTIEELLCAATHNEYEEADDVYLAFAEVAKQEGILEASSAFLQIAKIEKIHGNRFAKLGDMLKNGMYYQQSEGGEWMCLNCGHIHKGMLVPEVCPVCRHEKGYFIPTELSPYTSPGLW
jgi:rubrerythrin